MNFTCKKIEIHDEPDSCSVTFWEREQVLETATMISFDELLAAIGKYVMLQHTFADNDYYIESSKDGYTGELKGCKIELSRTHCSLAIEKKQIEIDLQMTDVEFDEVKRILISVVNGRGEIILI